MQKVVRGQNNAPNSHLFDSAPNDVEKHKALEFRLMEQAAGDRDHNAEIHKKRTDELERAGAYRVEKPVSKFDRSFKPRFGDEVHKVQHTETGQVVDEQGRVHAIKFVQPVPTTSAQTQPRDQYTRQGNARVDIKRQQILEPFADRVANEIRKAGGTLGQRRIADFLKKLRGFDIAARQAGLRQASILANFLKLFPNRFQRSTEGDGRSASVSLINRRLKMLPRDA